MKSVHLLVTGRVQGVGFRWFVRQKARELRLAGWVMNRGDGSVEVAASGEADDLERLRKALRKGPPGASVTDVTSIAEGAGGELNAPFEIRR